MQRRAGTPVDSASGAAVGISRAHEAVHSGIAFHAFAFDDALGDAGTVIVAFKTPAGGKHVHLVMSFGAIVAGNLDLIEGPTWTGETGTGVAISNRRRTGTPPSSIVLEDVDQAAFTASDQVIKNPTGLSGGTVIPIGHVFGSKQAGGCVDRGEDEWELDPDQTYAVRFTAIGAANGGTVFLDWYEATDGL
ncbi:MAG: hypothetical protein DRJ50_02785 [Actinobacteria bacterium]|nr:MAG: hypothetical protein DRJ50_02785 [Actinomycetota bacterium]